jgi:PAS domain S-box-containing protein
MSSSNSSEDVYTETLAVFDTYEDAATPLTTPEVADSLDIARRTVYKRLEKLVDRGDLKTKKVGANARVWWRPVGWGNERPPSREEGHHTQAGQSLQESEERYRTLAEEMSEGFALCELVRDADGRVCDISYIELNEAFEELTGISRIDAEGRRASDVFPERDDSVFERYSRVAETGEPEHNESYAPANDRWYDVRMFPRNENLVAVLYDDITERKQHERQLEQYKRIVETVGDGIFTVDATNQFSMVNEAYADMLGYTRDELIGTHASRVASVEDYTEGEGLKAELDTVGEVAHHELTLETKTGETVPVEARFSLLPSPEGEEFGVVAVVRDITDRKHAEEKLRENEAWLSSILEQLPAAIGVFNSDGEFRLQNGRMRQLAMGDRIPSRNPETEGDWTAIDEDGERLPPEQWPGARALRGEAVSPGIEFRFDGDGETRWMDVAAMPVGESEEVTEASVIIQDITDRKEREHQLEASRNRYRTLIENFPNGTVALVDEDLRFVTVSPPTVEEVLTTGAELAGKTVAEALPPEMADLFVPRYLDALNGEPSAFEAEFGEQVYQLRIVPVRNDAGRIFGAMAVSQDITERKRHEEELTAINHLNQVFQEVTHAVIESSSREQIEQTITEQLTNSDSYEYAWIGHLDRHGEKIIPQTAETDAATLSEITLSTETDDSTSHRTVAEAIRTRTVQVTYDSPADPVFKQWNQSAGIDHKAAASIPITFGERVYGVLTVYTEREDAFDNNERRIIERLSEVVGHAINSIDRKRALLEDRITELTFRSEEIAELLIDAIGHSSFTLSVDESIVLPGDQTITYYAVDGIDPDEFIDIFESLYPASECAVVAQTGSTSRVEVKTAEATGASELAKYNSWIVDSHFENGEFRVTVGVPQTTDVRNVIALIKQFYPGIQMIARTDVDRENPHLSDVFSDLNDQLTDRQRTALEVAYHSGYFDWPRAITGKELAERLDVTQGTVSHHIRHGEHKLLSAFFGATA